MKRLCQIFTWAAMLLFAPSAFSQDYNLTLRSTLQFPNQTLANVCGYAHDGREYALLGGQKNLIIVDVTNPDAPTTLVSIPGPNSLWKEIKVYSHYAYVTSEGGGGVQIVDLSALPGTTLAYHNYQGDGAIAGELGTIHALHIDVKKGFLYAYGSTLFNQGAVVLDLNSDPYNPVFVGSYESGGYVHDGYVDNDTLYAGHIYSGFMTIVDMSDKQNPVELGSVQTPGKFTHNTWLLDDHKHILTTDEAIPSFVTCYDISDPSDIKELSRVSTNDGTNSIGHNTHVLNDWAITSWYTDGVAIIDAHKPDNLVQVAGYDTWAESGIEENGCWGVYPYLPSGNLIVTNIPVAFQNGTGEMFILTPNYVRASYLEGVITDGCTGQPMIGASIKIVNGTAGAAALTKNNGVYKTGNAVPGNFTVTISKPGYQTQTFNVVLTSTAVTTLNATLEVANPVNVNATLVNAFTLQPISNIPANLVGFGETTNVQTDANGGFSLNCFRAGTYDVNTTWGYLPTTIDIGAGAINIPLQPGYIDNFGLDLGWSVGNAASSGDWVREAPIETSQGNTVCNPGTDLDSDNNLECYMTGNGGGSGGTDDVDNGSVTLISPPMALTNYADATLSFWYWFVNTGGTGGAPNDNLEVKVTNGTQTASLLTVTNSQSQWKYSGDISLKNFISFNDDVRVEFIASDFDPGHIVEAAIDAFKVVLSAPAVGVKNAQHVDAVVDVLPNPSSSAFAIRYNWPGAKNLVLEVRNMLGQLVQQTTLDNESGSALCGSEWPKGVYVAVIRSDAAQSAPVQLIKQ